jgi:threonyl-tRNA synthetase
MNCVGHISLFKSCVCSYKNLPVRLSEFGVCHRYEPSGSIQGLLRTRSFTQDDAHIFCRVEDIKQEVMNIHRAITNLYKTFTLQTVFVKISSPKCFAEGRLVALIKRVMVIHDVPFTEHYGSGAFYGVKVEYHLKDSYGGSWQCGTIQLDLTLPKNMDIHFINRDGRKSRPIIIHRAILGSLERFTGILLDQLHHVPNGLSLNAFVLLEVDKATPYKEELKKVLEKKRVQFKENTDQSSTNQRISYLHRKHVPHILVLGSRESITSTITDKTSFGVRVFTLESYIFLVSFQSVTFNQEEDHQ